MPSGEKRVFEAEKALLESRGHEVELFTRNSDEILAKGLWGKIQGALSTPWNPWMALAVLQKVDAFKPDIVHVHNTFPLISPSVFHAIGFRSARVMTLHNYRLFCAAAIPMRRGKVCTECLDRHSVWPAIKHGCYRDSRFATLPLAINVALHRNIGTWTRQVDAFIALSEFQKHLMAKAGLPEVRITVKPNFYPGDPIVTAWEKREPSVVFVGRLGQEKGVETLIKAWALWGRDAPELKFVGDGPLRYKLQNLASNLPVRFLGQLSPAQAQNQIAGAKLLILPSEWFEGFPMVLSEAFAFGTPVAVSNIGSLPSIVTEGLNGVIFEPANPESLMDRVRTIWGQQSLLEKMGVNARKIYEESYEEEKNYEMLMGIYEKAIAENKRS